MKKEKKKKKKKKKKEQKKQVTFGFDAADASIIQGPVTMVISEAQSGKLGRVRYEYFNDGNKESGS